MNYPIGADDGFRIGSVRASEPGKGLNRSFSLAELWAVIYRARFWIAGIMLVCLGAAVAYSLLATKLYDSTASVEVRQEADKVLGTEADREGSAGRADTERFLETELDILRSRGLATLVAENLGLFRGDGFLERMRIAPAQSGSLGVSLADMHREQVIRGLDHNLKVEFVGLTRIATIRFRSPDPVLSAQVANAYADAFIRSNLSRKFNSSAYALDFLRGQLAEAQQRLENSEHDVLANAREARIVDASNAAGANGGGDQSRPQSLITAQLVQLNQAYATALADRIQAQEKWSRTASLPLLSIPEVLGNSAIQGLLERRAQTQAILDQQLTSRRDDFPTVKQTRAQLDALNAQITGIASSIRNSIKSPFDVASAREQEINRQLERLKNSTLTEQNQGIQLSILRRAADTNRQQYDALLKRYNELNAEAGVQTNNLAIVDRADVPQASSWPSLLVLLAGATFVGLLLSTAFVIAREQLFDAVRTPDDITERLHLPLLGSVPGIDAVIESLDNPKSAASEAFNTIRTGLALASIEGIPRTFMITSAQASEGKSTATYALALSLARLQRRVVVVDADFRRPNVHRLFGAANSVGLSNVLVNQRTVDQAVLHTGDPMIDILPAGVGAPNPTELMNSPALGKLFAQLAESYDHVLVDSAPVLGLADAVILSSRVEATVFVVEAGRNTFRGLSGALRRLEAGDRPVSGVILSKFDPGRFGYGYGDEYGYSYRYEYGQQR